MKFLKNAVKYMRSWSLRTQLIALTLSVALPVIAVFLYNTARHRMDLVAAARRNALQVAQAVAFQQESEAEGLRQLLVSLSLHREVRDRDVAACNLLLSDIVKDNPRKLNLGIADPSGKVFASGRPFVPYAVDISSRKYFKDAVKSGGFSSGEYVLGAITREPSFHFSYPVFDAAGALRCVLYASVNRKSFDRLLDKLNLPPGSVLNLTDHRGVIVYRSLDAERYVGRVDIPAMRAHVAGTATEGSFFDAGIDGVYRLYSFKQLFLPGSDRPYLYIRVGVPTVEALKVADRMLFMSLVTIAAALGAVLAIAWSFGNYFIVRRIRRLVDAARKMGEGDLSARTGITDTEGELGMLASTFDEMGTALMRHEEERERLIGELTTALANVKLLSGFLPICSSCKKIRDDAGYWRQVEDYVASHSEAVFSHGLCPDCLRKLYPDLAQEVMDEMNRK